MMHANVKKLVLQEMTDVIPSLMQHTVRIKLGTVKQE